MTRLNSHTLFVNYKKSAVMADFFIFDKMLYTLSRNRVYEILDQRESETLKRTCETYLPVGSFMTIGRAKR
ncbi:hypothetical protein GCM10011344_24830 [Dokdonia pacifica]|nr:hypothetical protein GCM10011344_24830 [Dokdonia pacifica]